MNAPATEQAPIEAKGLAKTYRLGFFMNRNVRALQGLDLSVPSGRIYGLVGPNGAGKSTTIKILMNLVQPSGGSALVFGKTPSDTHVRKQVGFLPENPAPYEYLTGREFVTLAGRLCGMSGEELDRRVTEVLGQVEMTQAEKLQIRRYSKGMVQRIALAQALVGKPKLLVLDEPTSGLDPLGRRQMRELILAERDRGTTVLFCTHIISDVEATCDRLAILVGGKRVREGSVHELLATGSSSVEVAVNELPADRATQLGISDSTIQRQGGQVLLTIPEGDSQELIGKLISANVKVTRVQPARVSLEQLFIDAVNEGGKRVGGEINA